MKKSCMLLTDRSPFQTIRCVSRGELTMTTSLQNNPKHQSKQWSKAGLLLLAVGLRILMTLITDSHQL